MRPGRGQRPGQCRAIRHQIGGERDRQPPEIRRPGKVRGDRGRRHLGERPRHLRRARPLRQMRCPPAVAPAPRGQCRVAGVRIGGGNGLAVPSSRAGHQCMDGNRFGQGPAGASPGFAQSEQACASRRLGDQSGQRRLAQHLDVIEDQQPARRHVGGCHGLAGSERAIDRRKHRPLPLLGQGVAQIVAHHHARQPRDIPQRIAQRLPRQRQREIEREAGLARPRRRGQQQQRIFGGQFQRGEMHRRRRRLGRRQLAQTFGLAILVGIGGQHRAIGGARRIAAMRRQQCRAHAPAVNSAATAGSRNRWISSA